MKHSINVLYLLGKITKEGVKIAVEHRYITESDYTEITGDPYA